MRPLASQFLARNLTVATASFKGNPDGDAKLGLPTKGYLVGAECVKVFDGTTGTAPVHCAISIFYEHNLGGITLAEGWVRAPSDFNSDGLYWSGRIALNVTVIPYLLTVMRNDTGVSQQVQTSAWIEG